MTSSHTWHCATIPRRSSFMSTNLPATGQHRDPLVVVDLGKQPRN